MRGAVTDEKAEAVKASPERTIVVACPEVVFEPATDRASELAILKCGIAALSPPNNPLTDDGTAGLAVVGLPPVPEKPGITNDATIIFLAGWKRTPSRAMRGNRSP
jgi:hypothetical protein